MWPSDVIGEPYDNIQIVLFRDEITIATSICRQATLSRRKRNLSQTMSGETVTKVVLSVHVTGVL